MRALVTGAGGFVGRHLVEHLLESGDEVVATDRFSASAGERGPISIEALDVTNPDHCADLMNRIKPEVIYHLAGIAFVPEAERNFANALLINVGGTNNIVRACHLLQNGATVVYIGSAEVYGRLNESELPMTEETPVRPVNSYSLTKYMGELVCERYQQFGYVRVVMMRPFNHVGPGQNEQFVVSSFAAQLARISKGVMSPEILVGNLDARRDFSDVRDIVRAYRLAAQRGNGIYNLCSGQPVAIQEILSRLIAISGLNVQVDHDPARMRPSEVPVVYGSYARAEQEFDWRPEISLEHTLRDVYQYWLDRLN